jgi:hypothetical protein
VARVVSTMVLILGPKLATRSGQHRAAYSQVSALLAFRCITRRVPARTGWSLTCSTAQLPSVYEA